MAVLIMGLSDIGFCVFSLGSIFEVDVLDNGCGGIFNVLSASSLMSFTFTWCMCIRWYCCWCVWLVFVGGWWISV